MLAGGAGVLLPATALAGLAALKVGVAGAAGPAAAVVATFLAQAARATGRADAFRLQAAVQAQDPLIPLAASAAGPALFELPRAELLRDAAIGQTLRALVFYRDQGVSRQRSARSEAVAASNRRYFSLPWELGAKGP